MAWAITFAQVTQAAPAKNSENNLKARISGKLFKPEIVAWNSRTIIFRQAKGQYTKVEIRFLVHNKRPSGKHWLAKDNKLMRIFVMERKTNKEPVKERSYIDGQGYTADIEYGPMRSGKVMPIKLDVKLPGGDFIKGDVLAQPVPAMTWDVQLVEE